MVRRIQQILGQDQNTDAKIVQAASLLSEKALAKMFPVRDEQAAEKAKILYIFIQDLAAGETCYKQKLGDDSDLLNSLEEAGMFESLPRGEYEPSNIKPGAKLVPFLKAGIAKKEVGGVLYEALELRTVVSR